MGHDKLLDINTVRCKGDESESYLVSNEMDLLPFRLHSLTQWTFAVVGLSLPYRLLLHLSMGHVRYRIKKRIQGTQTVSVPNGRGDRVFTVEGSPPPYTPAQFSVPRSTPGLSVSCRTAKRRSSSLQHSNMRRKLSRHNYSAEKNISMDFCSIPSSYKERRYTITRDLYRISLDDRIVPA